MPATINLGKDYTVSGLPGVTDLTVSRSADGVDTTTRSGDLPIKRVKAGIPDYTFEGTVLGTATTSFQIGKEYALTLGGGAKNVICMDCTIEEPQEGVYQFKLTMRPGVESEAANKITIGPATWRT